MLLNVSSKPYPVISKESWRESVTHYLRPRIGHSLWQVVNTVIPFLALWTLTYLSLSFAWWLALLLAPLAAGFRVRLFIIFHDCAHGSFFQSKRANAILGSISGVLTLTPYYQWRHKHALHHANSGVLEYRGGGEVMPMSLKTYLRNNGDILTLTVKEYVQLSAWQRLVYRIYRHPVMLFLVLPALLFLILNRFPGLGTSRRERYSVYGTNLAILAVILVAGLLGVNLWSFLVVELLIAVLTSSVGGWLFYVQHSFEQTYWQPRAEWDFATAALRGSSYYKLPLLLQWFTGNIGFHHIHHLSPRVPNYYLSRCHRGSPLFQQTRAITFWSALRSVFSNLWDEEQQKMIAFGHLKVALKTLK